MGRWELDDVVSLVVKLMQSLPESHLIIIRSVCERLPRLIILPLHVGWVKVNIVGSPTCLVNSSSGDSLFEIEID